MRVTIVRAHRLWHAGADDLQRVHKEVMGLFLSSNMLFPGAYKAWGACSLVALTAVAGPGLWSGQHPVLMQLAAL